MLNVQASQRCLRHELSSPYVCLMAVAIAPLMLVANGSLKSAMHAGG